MGWGANSVQASTATRYLYPFYEDKTAETGLFQVTAPRDGTLRNMFVRHNSPNGNGGAIVYTLLVNGADTALTVSLASTGSTASLTGVEVAVSQGDLLAMRVTKAAAVGSTPNNINVTMEYA